MKPPYLKKLRIKRKIKTSYPYNASLFKSGDVNIDFQFPICILTGENGSGKSTLLQAISENIGFSKLGGSSDHFLGKKSYLFGDNLTMSWLPKVNSGFYFRADKLSHFNNYIDKIAAIDASVFNTYNGSSLNNQSHGEAVIAIIEAYTRFRNKCSILLLDEPESGLSIKSQIKLGTLLSRAATQSCQIILATHSPILMALQNSNLFWIENGIQKITLEEIEPFLLTRHFVRNGAQIYQM